MRGLITFLWGSRDGGPESNVRMWGVECKWLGSLLVLHFAPGSREAFHSHAFNAVSWVLAGSLWEEGHKLFPADYDTSTRYRAVESFELGEVFNYCYSAHWRPVVTRRSTFHKVSGGGWGAWVFSLRGRWHKTWLDGQPGNPDTLTHGRRVVYRDLGSRSND